MIDTELSYQDYVSLKDKLTQLDSIIRPLENLLCFSFVLFFFHVFKW